MTRRSRPDDCLVALVLPSARARSSGSRNRRSRSSARSTRLIVQTVTVKDKDGKPIEGLTAKDFVVTEDGEPQDIAFVEFQRLVATRRRRRAATAPRRSRAAAAPAAARPPHAAAPAPRPRRTCPPSLQTGVAPPAPATSSIANRRLLILYFDLTAHAAARSDARLRRGAEVHRRRRCSRRT